MKREVKLVTEYNTKTKVRSANTCEVAIGIGTIVKYTRLIDSFKYIAIVSTNKMNAVKTVLEVAKTKTNDVHKMQCGQIDVIKSVNA